MPDVALPEIQRTSLAGAVLQIKALKLELDVLTFDFLDRPQQVGQGPGHGTWLHVVCCCRPGKDLAAACACAHPREG
jgi:hypothetical protein